MGVPVGRIPMGAFVARSKSIGVTGNVKELFRALDVRDRGFITLDDLDPELEKATTCFFQLAHEKYGSIGEFWNRVLDTGKSRRIDKDKFVKGCGQLGYPGDASALFKLLQPDTGRQFLCLDDLGPVGAFQARLNSEIEPPEARHKLGPPPQSVRGPYNKAQRSPSPIREASNKQTAEEVKLA